MLGAHLAADIPAPAIRGIHIGPLEIRLYALCMLTGVVAAAWITYVRWRARGGDPDLVFEVTLWSVLAGLVGGRIYHDITSSNQLGDQWYAPFAIWQGGLGIWGGVLFGVLAGAWVVRRRGASITAMMDAAAPGLLVAQAIGRLGNYFNQELFGGPTSLPWALEVDPSRRPDAYLTSPTFHPTFLYEMIWNLTWAALIVWLGKRFRIRPPGLFALYVAVYSLGRVFEEQLRVDPSRHFLGERLNFYVALSLFIAAMVWFWLIVRRGPEELPPAAGLPRARGGRARASGAPRG